MKLLCKNVECQSDAWVHEWINSLRRPESERTAYNSLEIRLYSLNCPVSTCKPVQSCLILFARSKNFLLLSLIVTVDLSILWSVMLSCLPVPVHSWLYVCYSKSKAEDGSPCQASVLVCTCLQNNWLCLWSTRASCLYVQHNSANWWCLRLIFLWKVGARPEGAIRALHFCLLRLCGCCGLRHSQ